MIHRPRAVTLTAVVGLPALAALAGVSGCSGSLPWTDEVDVRVANESGTDFDEVLVSFPGRDVSYGAVPAGGVSSYATVEGAYRYAYIEVSAGEDTFVLQPIDYVGESLLEPGRYTYVLDLDPSGSRYSLTLELRRDR